MTLALNLRYFSNFFKIKIHSKKTVKTSLDEESDALQDCVILLEQTDFGNTEKYLVSTLALSCRYLSNFFEIKIHCTKSLKMSLDAEFHALQDSAFVWTESILENPKNREKKSSFQHWLLIPDIFRNSFDIKIHSKKTLNTSLDAKFNALQEYITCIERIDFGNPRKSEKRSSFQHWY